MKYLLIYFLLPALLLSPACSGCEHNSVTGPTVELEEKQPENSTKYKQVHISGTSGSSSAFHISGK
jgi:hypothetical protein